MDISPVVFDREFARFKGLLKEQSNGREFTTFHEGLPAEWEAYKENVRNEAINRLQITKWKSAEIGSGEILKRVIKAIEINEHPRDLRNNLVAWQNRYGHNGRSHRRLLDAQTNAADRRKFEQWLFDFSQASRSEEELFESFRMLAGNRYDLAAYLFFLRDWTRFMPIAPATFDKAFRRLEIAMVTRQRCSWENYACFNDALRAVQRHLVGRAGLSGTRLIDAHSFCWILGRIDDAKPTISTP